MEKRQYIMISINQSLFEKPIEIQREVKTDSQGDYVTINGQKYYLSEMQSAGRRGYFINIW